MSPSVYDLPFGDTLEAEAVAQGVFRPESLTPKQIGRISFLFYLKYYLASLLPADFAETHHEVIREAEALIEDESAPSALIALLAREMGKSTVLTIGLTLWCISYRHKINIAIGSATASAAKDFFRSIKGELETNVLLRRDFGDLVPKFGRGTERGKWGETHIVTSNRVQVRLITPTSAARGALFRTKDDDGQWIIQRPDLVILDDMLRDEHSTSAALRLKLMSWIERTLFPLVDSDCGDIIFVGTPQHAEDPLMRLFNEDRNPRWRKIRRPACRRLPDGRIVDIAWPNRWDEEKFQDKLKAIGSLAFAREYELEPLDEGGQIFRRDWYRYFVAPSVPARRTMELVSTGYLSSCPKDLLIFTAIDPAISESDKAAYTAIITLGFSPSQRAYYVLDVVRDRISIDTQVQSMFKQFFLWDQRYLLSQTQSPRPRVGIHYGFVFETYGYQSALKRWFQKLMSTYGLRDGDWRQRVWKREETKFDKTVRAAAMSPMVEQGRLLFPVDADGQSVFPELEKEMETFPGQYRDQVDALQRAYSTAISYELRYARQGRYNQGVAASLAEMVKHHPVLKSYLVDKKEAA